MHRSRVSPPIIPPGVSPRLLDHEADRGPAVGAPDSSDSPPAGDPDTWELRQCLEFARSLAIRVARRNGFSRSDAEDFCSVAVLKILGNVAKIQTRFRGEGSRSSYLHSVVRNCLRDFLIALRGKWRPSSRAMDLGPLAVELERLRNREGHSDDDAFHILHRCWYRPVGRDELDRLVRELPVRARRRWVRLDSLLPAELSSVSEVEFERDRRRNVRRVQRALKSALAHLDAQQLSLVRKHFGEGVAISRIARQSGNRQRSLYSQKDRVLRLLRRRLEAEGVGWLEARSALQGSGVDLEIELIATVSS